MEKFKYIKTCMFLCFHVNYKHEAQEHACFHVKLPVIAYFYPPLHHNGKGSISSPPPTLRRSPHCFPLIRTANGRDLEESVTIQGTATLPISLLM